MNREELLTNLLRVAENAPDDLFHMNQIVHKASCGTARCLLGWSIVDPWFRKNTSLNHFDIEDTTILALEVSGVTSDMSDLLGYTNYKNLFGMDLDINPSSGDFHEVSKAEVIWNIKELMAGREALPYIATKNKNGPYAMGITWVNLDRHEKDK